MKEIYGRSIEGYKFADLHVHTAASEDVGKHNIGMSAIEAVLSAETTGLGAIAITDHNILDSSYEAFEFAEKEGLNVTVIPGMEISTKEGHVIALGLTSPIERRLSLNQTISLIHQQKGVAIAAHPFFTSIALNSIGLAQLERIRNTNDPELYLDGFEIYNAGIVDLRRRKPSVTDTNAKAQELYLNKTYDLGAAIGSSDTHRMTVGRGVTAYKGGLFDAISQKQTMAVMLEPNDEIQLIRNAVKLFGIERVVGKFNRQEFEEKYLK